MSRIGRLESVRINELIEDSKIFIDSKTTTNFSKVTSYDSFPLIIFNLEKYMRNLTCASLGFDEDAFCSDIEEVLGFFCQILKEQAEVNRFIGLSIIGFPDICSTLTFNYGSENCLELASYIGELMRYTAQKFPIHTILILKVIEGKSYYPGWLGYYYSKPKQFDASCDIDTAMRVIDGFLPYFDRVQIDCNKEN